MCMYTCTLVDASRTSIIQSFSFHAWGGIVRTIPFGIYPLFNCIQNSKTLQDFS